MLKSSNYRYFLLELAGLIILFVAVLSGYWEAGTTTFFLNCEILIYILFAFFNSFRLSNSDQPGPILFGGIFILIIGLFSSFWIALETQEHIETPDRLDNEVIRYISDKLTIIWPLLIISLIAIGYKYFSSGKKEKSNGLVSQLFFHTFTSLGLIVSTYLLLKMFDTSIKTGVLIGLVGVRILLEFYVNITILGLSGAQKKPEQ